jgi:hypothetical protein
MKLLQVANSEIDTERLMQDIERELNIKLETGEISSAEVEKVKNAELIVAEGDTGDVPRSLAYMMQNKETYRGLPGRTHRGLVGRLAIVIKKTFRKIFQLFINEMLAPQVAFNDYLVDYLYNAQDRLAALERWNKHERGFVAETTEKRMALLEKSHQAQIDNLQQEIDELKKKLQGQKD